MRAVVAFVIVAGCGRLGFDPGSPGDGGGDAALGRAGITVNGHLDNGTGPLADAEVWSTSGDTIVDVQHTGADGHATLAVVSGGSVSVFDAANMWMTTFLEVEPGDELSSGWTYSDCIAGTAATASVDLSWMPPGAAVFDTIQANDGCRTASVASGTSMMSLELDSRAHEPFDVALLAIDSSAGVVASAVKPGVAWHDGLSYSFATADWKAASPATIGFDGLPEGTDGEIVASFRTAGANVSNLGTLEVSSMPVTGSLLATGNVSVDASRLTMVGVLGMDPLPSAGRFQLFARVDVPLGTFTVGPPAPVPTLASWDPVTRRLQWSFDATGPADSFDALLGFYDTQGIALVWTVRTSGDRTELVLPPVPPDLVVPDLLPLGLDEYYLITNDLLDASTYAEARQVSEGGEVLLALLAVGFEVLDETHSGSYGLFFGPNTSSSKRSVDGAHAQLFGRRL